MRSDEKDALVNLCHEFPIGFPVNLGCTSSIIHDAEVGTSRAIEQPGIIQTTNNKFKNFDLLSWNGILKFSYVFNLSFNLSGVYR